MVQKIDPSRLGEGAVSERLQIEMQKVLENIADPNTPWKKARKITLTISVTPNEKRQLGEVSIDTKTTLAPAHGIPAVIVIGKDDEGKVVGKELLSGEPGQAYIDNEGHVRSDTGEKIEPEATEKKSNVVKFS